MTAPTVPVTINLADLGGPAIAGVTVTAKMSDWDISTGDVFVSAKPVTGTTDVTGTVVLELFPNAMAPDGLGTRGTLMRVTARPSGGKKIDVNASIPNVACNLADVVEIDESAGLSAAQIALAQVQGSRAAVAASAAAAAHIYAGTYASDPLTRPDGTAIQVGDQYFNSASNLRLTFNGATWVASDINTADLAASGGSALVGFLQEGAGAVPRTSQDKARERESPEDFGATADGSADDVSAFEKALTAAAGKCVVLGSGQTYRLSRPISTAVDVNLDLNGATLVAPAGALVASVQKFIYTGAPLLTTVNGESTFTAPGGFAGVVGDVLVFESDSDLIATGSYKHGQLAKITGISGSTVTISVPFYAAYTVARLRVMAPLSVNIRNGFLDLTGATQPLSGDPATGIFAFGDSVVVSNVHPTGSTDAGQGINVYGMTVCVEDCNPRGFLNAQGLPSGGRVGYGINVGGDVAIVQRCFGTRCKHVVTSAQRAWRTRTLRYIDCGGQSPKGEEATVANLVDLTTQPYWQAILDVHANVADVEIIRPKLDGVNVLINVRSPRVKIIEPEFTSRGCVATNRSDFLVNISESANELLLIKDAVLKVDPTRNGIMPYLVGIWAWSANAHGRIIVDGLDIDDGALFGVDANGTAAVALATTIDRIEFRRVRGTLRGGVIVGGQGNTKPLGAIGNLILDLDVSPASGGSWAVTNIWRFTFISKVSRMECHGRIDWRTASAVYPLYYGTSPTDDTNPPDFLRVSAEIHSHQVGVNLNLTGTGAMGAADFSGMRLFHHYDAADTFAHGVRINVPTLPSAAAKFRGALIRNMNAGTLSLNVSCDERSNLDLDGADLNTTVYSGSAGDLPAVPVGLRYTSALWPYALDSLSVDFAGNLYRATIPTTAALPASTRVRVTAPAAGGVGEWCYTGAVWKISQTLAA